MGGVRDAEDRFWDKVKIGDGCWEWTAGKNSYGYGQFRIGKATIGAPRVAWVMQNGPVPAGLFVCHHCDNRACVRPSHLWLGTNADNTADKMAKGREARGAMMEPKNRARGVRHGRAKLSEAQVVEIRTRSAAGHRQNAAIAREFGVATTTVHSIVKRRRWAHVKG